MCGICGILSISSGFDASEPTVVAMRDTMVHRGPDDAGADSWGDGRVAFGHRRLSIVDLSPAGHNPMPNEDQTVWITFNGEIYNHRALRSELEAKGHRYRSNTDTETIIHLYEEEGPRCVERLQGMFAIAIWDERRQELFLARDRLGIKPLYYTQPHGGFAFASEIKALLAHPAVSPDLDEEAFFHYLTFVCTPAPLTMFKGISKLAPGERMIVRTDGSTSSDIFWSPMSDTAVREVSEMSEAEMEERLLTLLRASIEKRMMADVPFGVFLSGGVDSSTNVALMSELMTEPVRTFSVAFKEYEQYNELQYAREIAQRFGADHHEIVIDWNDLESFLPEMIFHQDEPIADWVCVPLHYVSRLARENDTIVVQVGEGSDELFHGYDLYINAARFRRRFWEPLQRVPAPLRRGTGRAATELARRVGRGEVHVLPVAEAAAGRLPFWGGAICYQGAIKERVLAKNGHRIPDSYDVVERFWSRGRAGAPRRRPAEQDDLPRAQAAPRRAAADASRQDDDGDLGRGSRSVPRSRAGRVCDGAAAGDEGAGRRWQVPAQAGGLEVAAAGAHRLPPQTGIRGAGRRVVPGRAWTACPGADQGVVTTRARIARLRPDRPDVGCPSQRPRQLGLPPLEHLQRQRLVRLLGRRAPRQHLRL